MSTLASQICNQISSVFTKPTSTPPPLDILVDEISAAASHNGKIFVYGVGREGLMLKGLCMRLAHLGLSAHCVFDMTTPPISPHDLLIASAGPGGFSTVDAICGVARSNGARVLLLTAQPESGSSVTYASVIAHVPAQTMADDDVGESRPLLPMGSLYEGALFVLFEMVVFKLGEVLGKGLRLYELVTLILSDKAFEVVTRASECFLAIFSRTRLIVFSEYNRAKETIWHMPLCFSSCHISELESVLVNCVD